MWPTHRKSRRNQERNSDLQLMFFSFFLFLVTFTQNVNELKLLHRVSQTKTEGRNRWIERKKER